MVLESHYEAGGRIAADCVVEVLPERYGMLGFIRNDYTRSDWDIYVSPSMVRRYNLKTGDSIKGVHSASEGEGEKLWALLKIEAVTGDDPLSNRFKLGFDNLTPLYPEERLHLETLPDAMAGGLSICSCPLEKGRRALVVAPPRAGKTVLLQGGRAAATNHPEAHLIVLLVDERPEEVTDMVRSVRGEVISSTFDEPAARHVQVAEMVIQKAKRLVEHKQDVVILLDSITRLARAYNQVVPASGKILTGSVDSNALQKPKRFRRRTEHRRVAPPDHHCDGVDRHGLTHGRGDL